MTTKQIADYNHRCIIESLTQCWGSLHLIPQPWWCHQMETFSASLALCAGIHRSPGNSLHKGQWRGVLIFTWTNGRLNNRDVGDLRCHRAHYDVTVMTTSLLKMFTVLGLWKIQTTNRCSTIFIKCLAYHFINPSVANEPSILGVIWTSCSGVPVLIMISEAPFTNMV